MKKLITLLLMSIVFFGCGGGSFDASVTSDENDTAILGTWIESNSSYHKSLDEPYNPNRTITIYVHGFGGNDAYKKENVVFGADEYESFMKEIPKIMGIPTISNKADENKSNVFATTTYYGDTPPSYYTKEDREELEKITQKFGGGIPRYAMIIAKYTKHLLERTGAKQVNFISGSMGALVTRYLIEKDLEHLSSNKKIARWLTVEGVVSGNYAASNDALVHLVKLFEKPSIDLEHMHYQWIQQNLSTSLHVATSSYYKDILVGHESSTKDDLEEHALTKLLFINGQFSPNDAYQIVSDTYFHDVVPSSRFREKLPAHTYLHLNHLEIKEDKGAWAQIATFLTSSRRVKLILHRVKIKNIHEKKRFYSKKRPPAEVVISSKIFSPEVKRRWKIDDAISEILIDGAVPKIVKYDNDGEERIVNMVLYDDFVLDSEDKLRVDLRVNEIDGDPKYGVYESFSKVDYEDIGSSSTYIPLKSGKYYYESGEYSYEIEVDLYDYNFPSLGDYATEDEKLKRLIEYFYATILERDATQKELEDAMEKLHNRPTKVAKFGKDLLESRELTSLDNEERLSRANLAFSNNKFKREDENLSYEEMLHRLIESSESKKFIDSLLAQ